MDEKAEVMSQLAAAQLMPRSFFQASPEELAPQLLGKILAHSVGSSLLAGRIVEVEAYLGPRYVVRLCCNVRPLPLSSSLLNEEHHPCMTLRT